MENKTYPGSYYQPLFDLLNQEHGITPLESEMADIILVVEKMRGTTLKAQQGEWVNEDESITRAAERIADKLMVIVRKQLGVDESAAVQEGAVELIKYIRENYKPSKEVWKDKFGIALLSDEGILSMYKQQKEK